MRPITANLILGLGLFISSLSPAAAQTEWTTDANGNPVLITWPVPEGQIPATPRIRQSWSTGVFR